MKKFIGILLVLAGIALIGTSIYIQTRVDEGSEQIGSAQRNVNLGRALSTITPRTAVIGQPVADMAQGKIDSAQEDVTRYGELAHQLQIGGIALIILGLLVIFIGRKKT